MELLTPIAPYFPVRQQGVQDLAVAVIGNPYLGLDEDLGAVGP